MYSLFLILLSILYYNSLVSATPSSLLINNDGYTSSDNSLETRSAHPIAVPEPLFPLLAGIAKVGVKIAAKQIAKKAAKKVGKKAVQKVGRKATTEGARQVQQQLTQRRRGLTVRDLDFFE